MFLVVGLNFRLRSIKDTFRWFVEVFVQRREVFVGPDDSLELLVSEPRVPAYAEGVPLVESVVASVRVVAALSVSKTTSSSARLIFVVVPNVPGGKIFRVI